MTPRTLDHFAGTFLDEMKEIMAAKGQSYSGAVGQEGDRLANFKRVAERMGVTPLQCWLCYFLKHVDSVCTFVRTGHESEGFRSRALDIANYALLGAALNFEAETAEEGQ